MTDSLSKPAAESTPAQPRSGFRFVGVSVIVLPIALLMIAGVVFFGFFDGVAILGSLQKPSLVPASGQVTYNGEPLGGAEIWSQHATSGLRGARGLADQEGRFVLKTEIGGTFVDGAYPGKHKFTVSKRGLGAGASAPPLLTPETYNSFETTPLTFDVQRPPTKNELVVKLEGDPPANSGPPTGRLPTRGPGAGRPGGEAPPERPDADPDSQPNADRREPPDAEVGSSKNPSP